MTKKSYVAENGLTLGLAGLALLVIFAIALPRWTHHQDTKAINLPATLSDGYTLLNATTPPTGVDPAMAQQYLAQLKKIDDSASGASGSANLTGLYLDGAHDQLLVQAARGGGEASPLQMSVLSSGTYTKVGNDQCFTPDPSQSQQAPVGEVCRRSTADYTVQVSARDGNGSPLTSDVAAKYLDQIIAKVS